MRIFLLFLLLAALVIIPFLIWGESMTETFSLEGSVAILNQYGSWAWGVGQLLLIGDLFLPIPATVVMSALGYIYGWVIGGLLSGLGSFLSGAMAYELCKRIGERAAVRILGAQDFEKGQKMFVRVGGWIVAFSRWLPIFPEVVACMAGITRMPARIFYLALLCGSLPLGFVFAYIGETGNTAPGLALAFSAGLPPFLWFFARYLIQKKTVSD